MSNWCENVLHADSRHEEICRYLEGDDGAVDLSNIIATDSPKDDWGCKWNVESSEYCGDGIWIFITPWSEPDVAIGTLSERFPDVTFTLKYFEGGCKYAGMLKINGEGLYSKHFYDGNSFYEFAFKEEFLDQANYIYIDNEWRYFDTVDELVSPVEGGLTILVPNITTLKINDYAEHPKGAWMTPDGIMTRQGVLYAYTRE